MGVTFFIFEPRAGSVHSAPERFSDRDRMRSSNGTEENLEQRLFRFGQPYYGTEQNRIALLR